jgi:hypothetical protein
MDIPDFGHEEWRDKMVRAIGYRMHAMDPSISPVAARLQVRDFMKLGNASEYAGPVMRAAFELFGPVITVFAPVIRAVVSAMSENVEREIENGAAIEARRASISKKI